MKNLLQSAADRATRYLEGLNDRRVAPTSRAIEGLTRLDVPLPEQPSDPEEVLAELDEVGSPATLASAGGRFFGFVIGGAVPASVAANWLAGAWDQNAGMVTGSPAASRIEEIALGWLVELLALPRDVAGAFVTGGTMANFTAICAARHALLAREGWDVEADGLFGAPPVAVIVGEEAHVSVLKSLALAGFGRERVTRVPTDGQGRMRPDRLPPFDGPTLVCLQAGNVDTGAFDPAEEVCERAKAAGAWVHVDGAFGLWAAAAPERAGLLAGYECADSWATDAHKWLNVPYDSGIAFCRDADSLRASMAVQAAYLVRGDRREPSQTTPELSRRARGVEVWAAIRSLGRSGVADLIERTCRHATRFANGLRAAGHEVANDVVLNQVLVSFGDDETTRQVTAAVQADGTCWCGGTVWQGRTLMRISVSSWATTEDDVERSLDAILRCAEAALEDR